MRIINFRYGAPLLDPLIFCRYFSARACWIYRSSFANSSVAHQTLLASITGSILFYVITNAFSWLSDPGYSKNLAGFIQSLTAGLPQYSATPTWMFFRNSLASDLVFTGLFFVCMRRVEVMGASRSWHGSFPLPRMTEHAAGGATRRSRDALADAVDSALRGTRQSADTRRRRSADSAIFTSAKKLS